MEKSTFGKNDCVDRWRERSLEGNALSHQGESLKRANGEEVMKKINKGEE